jgi:hypothetical protein
MMHGISKDTHLLAKQYLAGAYEIQLEILKEYFVDNMLSVVAINNVRDERWNKLRRGLPVAIYTACDVESFKIKSNNKSKLRKVMTKMYACNPR